MVFKLLHLFYSSKLGTNEKFIKGYTLVKPRLNYGRPKNDDYND